VSFLVYTTVVVVVVEVLVVVFSVVVGRVVDLVKLVDVKLSLKKI